MGGYGLIEIVLERFIVNDVVEIDQLNTLLLDELQGKVAAGVNDEIALSGHGVPFQQAPYMRFIQLAYRSVIVAEYGRILVLQQQAPIRHDKTPQEVLAC